MCPGLAAEERGLTNIFQCLGFGGQWVGAFGHEASLVSLSRSSEWAAGFSLLSIEYPLDIRRFLQTPGCFLRADPRMVASLLFSEKNQAGCILAPLDGTVFSTCFDSASP